MYNNAAKKSLSSSLQEKPSWDGNNNSKRVDKEEHAEAQTLQKPATDSHGGEHDERHGRTSQTKRGRQAKLTKGMMQAIAKAELCDESTKTKLPESSGRNEVHKQIDNGRQNNKHGAMAGALHSTTDDKAEAERQCAHHAMSKAQDLQTAAQATVGNWRKEVEHTGVEHQGLWQKEEAEKQSGQRLLQGGSTKVGTDWGDRLLNIISLSALARTNETMPEYKEQHGAGGYLAAYSPTETDAAGIDLERANKNNEKPVGDHNEDLRNSNTRGIVEGTKSGMKVSVVVECSHAFVPCRGEGKKEKHSKDSDAVATVCTHPTIEGRGRAQHHAQQQKFDSKKYLT